MDVILCQDVKDLGQVGDVIKVKSGYARNFLVPRKLAYLATPGNLKKIELQRSKKKEHDQRLKAEAQSLADKLSKVSCHLAVEVNDLDKLYGNISETEIVQGLKDEGFDVDKKTIVFEKPIDELGIFDIGIQLHPEVVAKVRLWVTKK